jgi:stearoyl-CoA desaturase (delta-9 desaturase)
MHSLFFSGALDLPWWGLVLVALALTHVTIASVTIFLHRHQAHRALELHPAVSHFFRFWLWLTTGMVTRSGPRCTASTTPSARHPDDPHSPQVHGLNRVLWGGVAPVCARGGQQGNPGALRPRHARRLDRAPAVHAYQVLGIVLMGVLDMALFGVLPGALILFTQIAWIPFWAAGVVNGLGHYWGYRNWPAADASTNLFPIGIVIGGEELHNNHHAFPTSAKLSSKWYEFDIGWLYIRTLQALGLARVKHVAPRPRSLAPRRHVDLDTVQAVIRHHYDVLSSYTRSLKTTCAREFARLHRAVAATARALKP